MASDRTPSLADTNHLETCAGKHCREMLLRAHMWRIDGRRGWFCARCRTLYPPRTIS